MILNILIFLYRFYIASRVLVLFSVVYFYSTLFRFTLVTLFGVVAYLWNTGYFNRRPDNAEAGGPDDNNNHVGENGGDDDDRELINQEVDAVRQAATGEINRNNNESEEEAEQEEEEEEGQQQEQEQEQQQQQQQQPPQHSPMSLAFTFVTTFFSSLLPEQNAVV